jgi:flagellar basal-body rod protein FlgF
MFRGIYTATSGMMAANRKQEALTNNLANAETPGFKQDNTVLRAFPDVLIQRINSTREAGDMSTLNGGRTPLGTLHTGVYAQEFIPLFAQGGLKETGRMVDMAIVDQSLYNPTTNQRGHLFFAVQLPDGGVRYTRNGQFALDAEGFLVTGEGYRVLNDQQQPIFVEENGVRIDEQGNIFVRNEDGEFADGNIYLAYTEQPELLVKEGNGLYRLDGGALPDVATVAALGGAEAMPFQILQGFIETSNVDVTQTMTDMLQTFRLYEANQRVLQTYDRSLEKTVNEVGKVF